MAQVVKNLPAVQKTLTRSLAREEPLEEGMATHSSVLAWRIPWIEEPGGLQSMGLQRDTIALCICQPQPPNPSHPLLPPLCTQVCSPHLHLYSCSANRFIRSEQLTLPRLLYNSSVCAVSPLCTDEETGARITQPWRPEL